MSGQTENNHHTAPTQSDTDTGLLAYQQGDFAAALTHWQQLAGQGNSQAMHNLAILYGNGQGVEQNDETAQQWCEKAAQAGLVQAQTHLGYLLQQQQNFQAAFTWWQKAAQAGDADAQNNLGLAYHNGEGVAQDDDTAADYFEEAALQNHAGAQYNLGVLYANGQRFTHARHWWQKAAQLGNQDAKRALQQLDSLGV